MATATETETSVLQATVVAIGQRVLDTGLRMNPHVVGELSELKDVVIGVEVTDIQWQLFFVTQGQRLEIMTAADCEPDTWIKSDIRNLIKARYATPGDGLQLEISGDVSAGQSFQHILKAIEFDWEELLAGYLGDIAAHRVGQGVRGVNRWLQRTGNSLAFSTGEYLREEIQIAADREQIKQFISAVDELRDDVERLAARVQRLGS